MKQVRGPILQSNLQTLLLSGAYCSMHVTRKIAIITLKIVGTTVESVGAGAGCLDSSVYDGFIKPFNQAFRVCFCSVILMLCLPLPKQKSRACERLLRLITRMALVDISCNCNLL
jgi:hypothetical protein